MCRWKVRSRKGSTNVPSDGEDMIDPHLAELQLLNSAAVIHGPAKMNGRSVSGEMNMMKSNGHSAAAAVDEEKMGKEEKTSRRETSNSGQVNMMKSNGHSAAAAVEEEKMGKVEKASRRETRNSGEVNMMKSNGHSAAAAVDEEKIGKEEKTSHRETSYSGELSKFKKSRGPADIDSLSPEVIRALQSTFGGKLDEIRSRFRPTSPSPPPTPSPVRIPTPLLTPPSSPPRPPSSPEKTPRPPSSPEKTPRPPASPEKTPRPPSSPEKTPRPPSSPEKLPKPPSPPKKRTFVERLADREGAYMLIAYFSAIFLSGFILLATEEDDSDGNVDSKEDFCRGMGIESGCSRLFGYIFPVVFTASFFTVALVFFVFDVSFSFLSILTAAKGFFFETKKNKSTTISGEEYDDGKNGWTRPTVAGLMLLFVSDFGFIVASSALLWISKISTMDPLQTICEWRIQLLWMVGLMVMDIVILLSAVKSFSDPGISEANIHAAAKRVSIILCVLLACTAAFNGNFAPDSKEIRPCPRRTPPENPIQIYEPLQNELLLPKCADKDVPELLQCEWRPQKVQHLDWCEAYQQSCDWPRAKQIQLYEPKDVCRIDWAQCDWPFMKQLQLYENKDRCEAVDLDKCNWPWVKQIQVYEHNGRCQPKDVTLLQCDWPWLKQIQLFEAQDRCPLKNPDECEWPLLKQIQIFEREDSSAAQICRWSNASTYTS